MAAPAPQWTSAATFDYHPAAGSPLLSGCGGGEIGAFGGPGGSSWSCTVGCP